MPFMCMTKELEKIVPCCQAIEKGELEIGMILKKRENEVEMNLEKENENNNKQRSKCGKRRIKTYNSRELTRKRNEVSDKHNGRGKG